MRRYYGTRKQKEPFNEDGKVLLTSILSHMSLSELKDQKEFYENDKIKLSKIFNEKNNKNERKNFDITKKDLRPLLKKLSDEAKIVGDKDFYKIKRIFFEKKKVFSKNEVSIEIKLYGKDDTKGSNFLKIAKLIANTCDKINTYKAFVENQYEVMNKFREDHDLRGYQHPQHEEVSMFDNNFDNSDCDFLRALTYGRFYGFDKSSHASRYKVSEFFIDTISEPQTNSYGKLWEDYIVDHEPSTPPQDIQYYNYSDFMKEFKKISKRFEIKYMPAPGEDTKIYNQRSQEYASFKQDSFEFIEKFLRRIDLATRAKTKANKKDENLGYVYVLSNEAYPNIYKIGSTYGLPEIRAEELTGTGHLTPFKVVNKIKIYSAEYYEKSIHKLLYKYRVIQGREFFKLDLDKIKECLKKVSQISEKGAKKIKLDKMKKEIKF
jgi:hypothetical protein